jgi:hypothetical protein
VQGFQRKENKERGLIPGKHIGESEDAPLNLSGVLNMKVSIETDHKPLFD